MVVLLPGDIFLTRGTGWKSRLVRFFSRHIGESRTLVNHVGIVVRFGDVQKALVVEALSKVRRHTLGRRYAGTPHQVGIYRPCNVSGRMIAKKAESYVGRKYGTLKLVAHFLDWCLQGAYVFRRLAFMKQYPICSFLVAHACAEVGITFGVAPAEAEPDDILDYITCHPNEFLCIRGLSKIQKGEK